MNKKFRGRYLHKLDEKGRLIIPKNYRGLLESEIVIGKDVALNCINIYTNSEIKKIDSELEGKSSFDQEARKMQTQFYSNSEDCTMDKQGRIAVPTWLLEEVGIDKEVWLLGAGTFIEVWDKETFENKKTIGS